MSQIYKPATASVGPIPPTVIVEVDTQDGNATTANSILILNGVSSSENNDNSIITKGGVAGTGTANEVDIVLTNRITGTVSTSTTTQIPIITFSLGATPGTYYVYGNVQAFDANTPAGGGFSFSGAYRTNGTTGVELGKEFHDDFKSVTFLNADINLDITGNNVIVSVIGLNLVPINWNALMEFRRVF